MTESMLYVHIDGLKTQEKTMSNTSAHMLPMWSQAMSSSAPPPKTHPVVTRSGAYSLVDARPARAGRDYPDSPAAVVERFRSEASCRDYLERVRWPDGFVCPTCAMADIPWRSGTGLVACRHCREPVILTQHTLFHSATVPLSRWLGVLWELCDRETLDEVALRGALGLTDSDGIRTVTAALRSAMAWSARALDGRVQLGHAPLLFEREARDGRGVLDKAELAIVVELGVAGEPRAARMQTLRRGDRMEVLRFARENVSASAQVAAVSATGIDTAVQRVASLLELWLASQGGAKGDALDSYLCEFCFRFERRAMPRGRAFYDLLVALLSSADRSEGAALTG
jgi:Transposase zinc-ribbon domain